MVKNIAVKVNGIRNRFNEDKGVFQYVGIDRYGYTYNFDTTQKIPFNSYLCIMLHDWDVFEEKVVLCKDYSLYPLEVIDGKLMMYGYPFKGDKIR